MKVIEEKIKEEMPFEHEDEVWVDEDVGENILLPFYLGRLKQNSKI